MEDLIERIIQTWSRDILDHQKSQIFTKLPYVNNLFNVFKGIYDLVYLPYNYMVEEGDISKGVYKGMVSFFTAVSIESLNLTEGFTAAINKGVNMIGERIE